MVFYQPDRLPKDLAALVSEYDHPSPHFLRLLEAIHGESSTVHTVDMLALGRTALIPGLLQVPETMALYTGGPVVDSVPNRIRLWRQEGPLPGTSVIESRVLEALPEGVRRAQAAYLAEVAAGDDITVRILTSTALQGAAKGNTTIATRQDGTKFVYNEQTPTTLDHNGHVVSLEEGLLQTWDSNLTAGQYAGFMIAATSLSLDADRSRQMLLEMAA